MINDLCQQFARVGACDGILRPSLGGGNKLHVHIGPKALAAVFQMAENGNGVGGGGGHDVFVLPHAGGGAIIENDAIFAQHQAVAHLAHGEG